MYTRIAISAAVLICGFALQGQTQPSGPTVEHAQGIDPCGWIGVGVSPMTRAFADSLGMAEPYGAIFDQPEPGSPAAHEGIQAGDVITAINGMPIMHSSDFATMISAMSPDTIVHLSTYRDGQSIEVQVMLGAGKCPSAQHGGVLLRIT
jgi:membrane-associated protease RseP (regulator of RpoE activity)